VSQSDKGPFDSPSVPDAYRRHLQPVIFEPWARKLIDFVGLEPDQVVLDVASGTGVVARAAAAAVGAGGQVIASDISPAMLAHVTTDLAADGAPVTTLESSATNLQIPDGTIDVVLCQQGFPFIPDRAAAAREMCRVLRSGGKAGAAVWLSAPRLDPFDTYSEVLRDDGVAEPFPHAYDTRPMRMPTDEVEEVFTAGGFVDIAVVTDTYELSWSSPEAAALGITGTPYGPAVAALDIHRQLRLMTALCDRMTGSDGSAVRHVMTAVLARGTAP
jgi:SAM-dependent methyltransferase